MLKDCEQVCRETLRALEKAHLRRHLSPLWSDGGEAVVRSPSGGRWLSFSSNDYLDLAHDIRVKDAARDAITEYGVGSGSSRLITGTHPAHIALERAIARFKGVEAALSFGSGYAAAMGFATAFLDSKVIVLLDKLCHACLIDACRLSGARLRVFRHNDLKKLETLLRWAREQSPGGRVVVMTESVFSMDGDLAPLKGMLALKETYGAELLIDEAHAVGVLGPQGQGLAAALGLTDRIEFHMGTLGKALGVSGGYFAGRRAMIEVLLNRARSFVYSTAPPPALAEAARISLQVAAGDEGDRRRTHLLAMVKRLAEGLGTPVPGAAILPLVIGDEEEALKKSAALREAGYWIPAIRYPSVALREARLRLTVSAAHTEAQIDSLIQAIRA